MEFGVSILKDSGIVVCRDTKNDQIQMITVIDERQIVATELDLCNDPKFWEAVIHLESGQSISLKGEQVRPFAEAVNWKPLPGKPAKKKATKKKGTKDEK